jgi:alcohol dehydrogenase (NADP+)
VFRIPDAISSDKAASMLCAGITTFSPLVQHEAGLGKKVGIIYIGGLGHFGKSFDPPLGIPMKWSRSGSSDHWFSTRKTSNADYSSFDYTGIMAAKALGYDEVVAISRTSTKQVDALKMGATKFIATDEDSDWANKNASTLDLIICTISSPKMPIEQYLSLLRVKGRFVRVGAPEDKVPGFNSKSQTPHT